MAKILFAFYSAVNDPENPNATPLFYESFINGLDKAGNDVWVMKHNLFGVDFGKIPEDNIASIKSFHPDLCIFFNNAFFDISDIVDCPIIIYEVDSPRYYANKDLIKQKPDRYLFFADASNHVTTLIEQFGVPRSNVSVMPFFTEVREEELEIKSNISFIGTKFVAQTEKTSLSNFVLQNPTQDETALYKNCIEHLKRNPQLTEPELIQLLHITSEKIIRNLDTGLLIAILSDEHRIGVLSSIADLGLRIYGTESWGRSYFGNYALNFSYVNKKVYSLAHNQHILNSSKIGISMGHLQATCGFPWRIADIMASSACLVTDPHKDFSCYFSGLPLPVYHSPAEARELCQTLLSDDSRRRDIVQQCNEQIDKNHRFVHILAQMESILHMDLGSKHLL